MMVTLEARQHDQTGESVPTVAIPSDLQPVSEMPYLSSQMGQLSRPVQGSPGFSMAHRPYRTLPSPAARARWTLHFFGMAGFVPADSYGSCLALVDDIGAIHGEFAAGMQERAGRTCSPRSSWTVRSTRTGQRTTESARRPPACGMPARRSPTCGGA